MPPGVQVAPVGRRPPLDHVDVGGVADAEVGDDPQSPIGVEALAAAGRWAAAYAPQRTAEVPGDLVAALAADEPARVAFEALGRDRYALR